MLLTRNSQEIQLELDECKSRENIEWLVGNIEMIWTNNYKTNYDNNYN